MYNAKVNSYKKEALKTQLAGADRYEITQMLMAGVLDKLVMAKVAITHNSFEAKSENISKASAILIALRESLDFDAGGEVSANLEALYSYMIERLVNANRNNDIGPIDETAHLMKEIKSAWDQIPAQVRHDTIESSHASGF
jgi:flagellar protein FliS